MKADEIRNLPQAVIELSGQEHFAHVPDSLLMDFMFELVNQYPLHLLAYISEQRNMSITAESTQRFDPPQ